MTFHDFESLQENVKMNEIDKHAIYLAEKTDGCYNVCLYQLHGFYIEIYSDLIKYNYRFWRIFDDTDELRDYLLRIDISSPGLKH